MFDNIPLKLFLALLLGAAIGLERENDGNKGDGAGAAGGIRTFSLVALLGALAGVFYVKDYALIFGMVAGIFSMLLIVYYALGSYFSRRLGLTNELAIALTFLLGVLLTTEVIPLVLTVSIFVVLSFILAFKEKSKELAGGLSRTELQSFAAYAIIALVVLPFLPDVGYTVSHLSFIQNFLSSLGVDMGRFASLELINPRKIWFIVVLITGIDVFGYFLGKFISSKKSFTATSFIGGFISSTSTTQSLAQKSKHTQLFSYLVGAAVLANVASFCQIFLLVGPLNPKWLIFIAPTLFFMIVMGIILVIYFLRQKEPNIVEEKNAKAARIFSLVPALKFAILLIFVKFFTKFCLILFGNSGFVFSSIIASFAGLDAILVNLADMAGGAITFRFAFLVFILVNATNLLSKSFYSFLQGSKKFSVRFLVSILIIIASSLTGLLFLR
jgi:uncharacterized membrane protein (DUF4010 family)